MVRGNYLKRFTVFACMLTLAALLTGCAGSSTGGENEQAGSQDSQQEATQPAEQQTEEKPAAKKAVDYSEGTHHAKLKIKGYDQAIIIEIYSDSAPKTAKKFCKLVKKGYYNKKTMYWILDDMYVRLGASDADEDNQVKGEYEEAGTHNSNSLKKGVVALSRAEDGKHSDAGSFIVFMSDMSYLDGKYAGFAKITEGYEVIEDIAALTKSDDKKKRIKTNKAGKIKDDKKCPVISSIKMVD